MSINIISEKSSEELIEIWQTETYTECREEFIARMQKDGLEVVFPQAGELQLDIDTEEQYKYFFRALPVIEELHGPLDWYETKSKGGNRHITVQLPANITDLERIAFQVCLGSDRVRELLSLARLIRGDIHPTLFVEKRNENNQD